MTMSQEDCETSKIPQLLGCDSKAQQIFAARYSPVRAFISTNLGSDLEWSDCPSSSTRLAFRERFKWLEERITQLRSEHPTERQAGRRRWVHEYLVPLAHQVLLYHPARSSTLRRVWRLDAVAHLLTSSQWEIDEVPEVVFSRLRAKFNDQFTRNVQAKALCQEGVCPDTQSARALVDLIFQVEEAVNKSAASAARGLLLSALEHGWIGLLHQSSYECTESLFLVQRQTDKITSLNERVPNLLPTVRADVIAFTYAIKQAVPKYTSSLANLLQEPRSSIFRQRFQDHLTSDQRSRAVSVLATQRSYTNDVADKVFESIITSGISALIDFRCSPGSQVRANILEKQHIRESIERNFAALKAEAREHCIILLEHILEAATETDFSFPLMRVLDQHPSNPYRVRLGRRFSFSFSSMIRQRHRRSKRRGQRYNHYITFDNQNINIYEDKFIAAISRNAGLSPNKNYQKARTLLRYLLTYGPIGLFPRDEWYSLINQRLVDLLHFFKLGRLDGALNWTNVMNRVQAYAGQLNIAVPSPPLTRAIFNSLKKPRRWHGGVGEAVSLVRQRASLVLNVPRLHQTWVALVVKPRLRLAITGSQGENASQTCEVIVIIDMASELPVGLWASKDRLDADDLCLALYSAIWHPGTTYWPLRGIPEIIQVPQWLTQGREDDLKQAAEWISADLQMFNKARQSRIIEQMPHIDKLIQDMSILSPKYILHRAGAQQISLQQAIELLYGWLYSSDPDAANYFPHHRSSLIPETCSKYGFLMPAHHFPGAGKLLPVIAQDVSTGRDKVIHQGLVYASPHYQTEPGRKVTIRQFPFQYTNNPTSIFVGEKDGNIYYLEGNLL